MNSDLPKVLHVVCGKPIIHYVIEVARSIGSLKIFAVLGYHSDVVKDALPADISVVIQKKLLGTADAIRSAEKPFQSFKGDVLILSGDTPLLESSTIKSVLTKHRNSKSVCTFLTAEVERHAGYGRIIRNPQGHVLAIREEKDADGEEKRISEINVGVYCFDSSTLFKLLKKIKINPNKKEYYLTDVIALMAQSGQKIETVKVDDHQQGYGINNKLDLAFAESVLRKKILNDFMLQGVTIIDPQNTYIDREVTIGRDTVIYPFSVIENEVKIGSGCKIGPFCHLRPGSKIADTVEIGNFTEISRTEIGSGTFVKHFSFLGDAKLGSRVNIGAGTVTANFDGVNKHLTTIKDDAFIGSDSILVAPVQIGKKSATGAGAVLPKGLKVPDGEVAVGIPARVTSRRKF